MTDTNAHKIELGVSNNKAYVWDVDDVYLLRAKHHICGVLTGTLPHVSQQNVFLGLPLILLPEEVVLLLEKNLAVIIDDPKAHKQPTPSQLKKWNNARISSVKAQIAQTQGGEKVDDPKVALKSMSEEAIRKRKEREEKRAIAAAAAKAKAITEGLVIDEVEAGAGANDIQLSSSTSNPIDERSSTPTPSLSPSIDPSTSKTPYTVNIPTDSAPSFEWYSTSESTYTSISEAKKAGIWTYPETLHERAKCGVFNDLWEKGYYMGGGIKFGGDYLVYPGDPMRYHSHFAATVHDSPIEKLRPMEIVSHGRLGTATKKAHLLCGWDDEKSEVSYYSIEWAGFG
ncbi:hypothetical protein C8Q75DRAFT_713983 [Abortiporus biennis]|nr:hypothetical protein C8Q75DRAFT_713983 [Abortiporus biennis]